MASLHDPATGLPCPNGTAAEDISTDTDTMQHDGTMEKISTLSPANERKYLKSWHLGIVLSILGLVVFIVTMEVSIVATSLVPISNSLGNFQDSSWIVTSYLLTYCGFLIVWAKLSDLFGRKSLATSCILLFTIFSAACGSAQTMLQLIILRAFQGIGGSGCYSICIAMFFEVVPPQHFAYVTSLVSAILAIALVLGPLFGGLINMYTIWRWIFWINIPIGFCCVAALLIALPNNFPHQRKNEIPWPSPASWRARTKQLGKDFSLSQLRRIDFLGTLLLLSATILSITVFQQAGKDYSWNSAFTITLLCLSAISWAGFLGWSWKITNARESSCEPVFPWRFMQDRRKYGLFLTIFLTGAPFHVAVLQIPLRFQIVNLLSPLRAGVALLPYAILNPFGSVIAPFVAKRWRTPPVVLVFIGSVLQTVGIGLLSTATSSVSIPASYYGLEALCGLGVGISLASLIVMTPFSVEPRDKAIAMSAMVQFRTLGGALGIAAATAAINNNLRSQLVASSFTGEQIVALLDDSRGAIEQLPQATAGVARAIFADAYNLQMKVMVAFSAAQVFAALLLIRKPQIRV